MPRFMLKRAPVVIVTLLLSLLFLVSACSPAIKTRLVTHKPNVKQAQISQEAPQTTTEVATETLPQATPEQVSEAESAPFSIAWVSDTQTYTAADNDVFGTMMRWIRDTRPDRTVHRMMMNVQDDLEKGVGYLRILKLDPNEDTLEVVTYSPVLDRYGYDIPVGGDRFEGSAVLEHAGLRDFLTPFTP